MIAPILSGVTCSLKGTKKNLWLQNFEFLFEDQGLRPEILNFSEATGESYSNQSVRPTKPQPGDFNAQRPSAREQNP